jgi:hypothetical protein
MIAPLLALLLAASEAPAPTGTTAAPASVEPALTPLQTARENTARVEQLYEQSCGVRGYAAYDDLCGPLAQEVHRNRVALDRLEREAGRRPKPVLAAKPGATTGALSSH